MQECQESIGFFHAFAQRQTHRIQKQNHKTHGIIKSLLISIGNQTVREVLMKNRTRIWRNVYNTASA